MICTPNTGHLVWGYFYALDLLSQVKKLAQHSNSIFAICNSQLLPTNQKCGLLSYPKKTKNPNPSPIGNRFGFFLFGGRGWIRTTEAEKQQIYSLSPLATREHAHILLCALPDDLFILAWKDGFVNTFLQISAGIFPGRDPDKKAPSGPGKRAPDGAWKHMLFSYRSLRSLKNQ